MPEPVSQLAFMAVGFIGGAAIGALVGWLRARFDANR